MCRCRFPRISPLQLTQQSRRDLPGAEGRYGPRLANFSSSYDPAHAEVPVPDERPRSGPRAPIVGGIPVTARLGPSSRAALRRVVLEPGKEARKLCADGVPLEFRRDGSQVLPIAQCGKEPATGGRRLSHALNRCGEVDRSGAIGLEVACGDRTIRGCTAFLVRLSPALCGAPLPRSAAGSSDPRGSAACTAAVGGGSVLHTSALGRHESQRQRTSGRNGLPEMGPYVASPSAAWVARLFWVAVGADARFSEEQAGGRKVCHAAGRQAVSRASFAAAAPTVHAGSV